MKKQIFSFECALRGLWYTIKSESHMRFHMIAGIYVLFFSLFYSFSVTQWAILILLIASVMSAEIVNTCIEVICNLVADRYEPLVKVAKDAAAGAVIIFAGASATIAAIFFIDFKTIDKIFNFFIANPILLVLLIISIILSVIFVWLGPVGIKSAYIRYKGRRNNLSNSDK